MTENILIRNAREDDIDFLIESIIHAEKSNTNKLSYSTIFEISESDVRNILRNILIENIEGQELCMSSFRIAEVNGEIAGACAAWIEGQSGQSSSLIRANLIYHFFPRENQLKANQKADMINLLTIEREKGALQFECAWVKDKFKGKKISNRIMLKHLEYYLHDYPNLRKAQIIMVKSNEQAWKAHRKLGFRVVKEVYCNQPEILQILPSDRMMLIEANIDEIIKNI